MQQKEQLGRKGLKMGSHSGIIRRIQGGNNMVFLLTVLLFLAKFRVMLGLINSGFNLTLGSYTPKAFGMELLVFLTLIGVWFILTHLTRMLNDYEYGYLKAGKYELLPLQSGEYYTESWVAVEFQYKGKTSGKLGTFPKNKVHFTQSFDGKAYAVKHRSFFSLKEWTYEIALPVGSMPNPEAKEGDVVWEC